MKALITGASSGIGRDMARYLSTKKIDLILVARRKENLEELQKELPVDVKILIFDLSKEDQVYQLYETVKHERIDLLINNAGFGLFGKFLETDLSRELEMIDLNVRTYHILTKLFLQDFYKRDSGYILNVCSSAGFLAGPNMATYYATKNYVTKLTLAIREELKHQNSNVVVSVLCPGPVQTEFNQVAMGTFRVKGLSSEFVARYAIEKLFRKKMILVPGFTMKFALFFCRFLPWSLILKFSYQIQKRKESVQCKKR